VGGGGGGVIGKLKTNTLSWWCFLVHHHLEQLTCQVKDLEVLKLLRDKHGRGGKLLRGGRLLGRGRLLWRGSWLLRTDFFDPTKLKLCVTKQTTRKQCCGSHHSELATQYPSLPSHLFSHPFHY
jgi:hypothetical protein